MQGAVAVAPCSDRLLEKPGHTRVRRRVLKTNRRCEPNCRAGEDLGILEAASELGSAKERGLRLCRFTRPLVGVAERQQYLCLALGVRCRPSQRIEPETEE